MARLNEDRATRYHRSRRRARLGGRAAALSVVAMVALTGAGTVLARTVETWTAAAPAAWVTSTVLFTSVLVGLASLARLPFDVFMDWILERRYGLEQVRLSTWAGRYLREVVLRLGLVCAAAVAVRGAFLVSREWGWAVAAMALWLGHLWWSLAMPHLLVRSGALRPLESRELVECLTRLGRRLGVPFEVAQWHAGGARHAHAILLGLGRQPRVILSDTLVETLSDEEIEVVVAHELAHQVHGDVWTTALWRLAVLTAAFGSASPLLGAIGSAGTTNRELAGLAFIGLTVAMVAGIAAPVGLALSRRHERRADAFALTHTGKPEAFVSSMRRLAANNLIDDRPTRLTRLLSSHPSVNERVMAALRRSS